MAPMMDAMTGVRPWTTTEFGLTLAMWAVMMVAMMVPTTAPMTLMYAAVARKAADQHKPLAPTFVFVTGYIAMWTIFSLVATIAQHALDRAALLSPMMVSRSASVRSRAADRGWRLPAHPVQERLSEELPHPSALPFPLLCELPTRRLSDGTEARRLLRGLLLDLDGIAVRRRRDELPMDRGDRHLRPSGEDSPIW